MRVIIDSNALRIESEIEQIDLLYKILTVFIGGMIFKKMFLFETDNDEKQIEDEIKEIEILGVDFFNPDPIPPKGWDLVGLIDVGRCISTLEIEDY